MKYTALAAVCCIGFLAWYSYPDSSPPVETTRPANSQPEATAGPQRFASVAPECADFLDSEEWQQLRDIYSGMSDAALCDFVLEPDNAKLEGVDVNPLAAEMLLRKLMSEHKDENAQLADVPDLRYYLDPQAIQSMRGLTQAQLLDRINNERSAEAAYVLAQKFHQDEQTYVMLMLSAASYAQKPGPLLNAINGCCSWAPDDAEGQRAAAIKREALIMIAREMDLPEAEDWQDHELDPGIEADVLQQRAVYVQELNQYSMEAFGEEWVK